MVVEVRRVVIDALRRWPAAPAPALAAFNEEAEGHQAAPGILEVAWAAETCASRQGAALAFRGAR